MVLYSGLQWVRALGPVMSQVFMALHRSGQLSDNASRIFRASSKLHADPRK